MKAETSERSGPQGSQAERGARAPIPGVAFESCQNGPQRLPVVVAGSAYEVLNGWQLALPAILLLRANLLRAMGTSVAVSSFAQHDDGRAIAWLPA